MKLTVKGNREIKASLFQRTRDKRWVLTVAFGETWEGKTQITAAGDIRAERAAVRWAKERLGEIQETGRIPDRVKNDVPCLRDVHEELMRLRENLPDRKAATLKNNRTHLKAQILRKQTLEANGKKLDATICELPMSRIDVQRARLFVQALRARVSPSHTRNIVFTCRVLWDTAMGDMRIVRTNPWRDPLVVDELPKSRNVNVLSDDPDPITMPLRLVQATLLLEDAVLSLMWRVKLCLAVLGGYDDGELPWAPLEEPPRARRDETARRHPVRRGPRAAIASQSGRRRRQGLAEDREPPPRRAAPLGGVRGAPRMAGGVGAAVVPDARPRGLRVPGRARRRHAPAERRHRAPGHDGRERARRGRRRPGNRLR